MNEPASGWWDEDTYDCVECYGELKWPSLACPKCEGMVFCPECSCVCDKNRCPLCGETVAEMGDEDDEGELSTCCVNCDGRLCMSCVFREVHDECEDDCPFCCAGDEPDLINEPPHYQQHPSGVECIQITEWFNFCLGNAIKYIWRSDHKGNQLADLRKARFYLDREITRLEAA